MGTLYLVRHGQASFGAADYDQLSELGARQCRALGAYFAERHVPFEAVLRGTLRRHAQSMDAFAVGYTARSLTLPTPLDWPGLNEYDSEALLAALPVTPGQTDPGSPEGYKRHFRLLRDALAMWMAGTISPHGMPSYTDFVAGATAALAHIRQHHGHGNVLVVSSGGPIATLVGHLLSTPPETTIELNLQIRNTALTELVGSPHRQRLVSFNTLPHLDSAEHRGWVTAA